MTRHRSAQPFPGARRYRAAAVAAAATALLTLTGCESTVTTAVEVTGVTTARVTVSATFTGEAGAALAADTSTQAQLVRLFDDRAGVTASVDVDTDGNWSSGNDSVTVSAEVPYGKIADLADTTGVSGVALRDEGREVAVSFVPASRLVQVVTSTNAGQPDADALTKTMLQFTDLRVEVHFPGGVADATLTPSAKGHPDRAFGHTDEVAWFERSASDTASGTFTVSGSPSGTPAYQWALVGLLIIGAAAWWTRRRH